MNLLYYLNSLNVENVNRNYLPVDMPGHKIAVSYACKIN